jgi:hypothetical protein
MNEKTKRRRKGSPLAQGIITAAAHNVIAARSKEPDYAAYNEREAAKLMVEPRKRLPRRMVEGIGVGGEMRMNTPLQLGDAEGLRLRDTVKEPNNVTATAQLDRLRLAEEAGALDIALDTTDTIQPRDGLEKMLAHQLSALHVLIMRMTGTAQAWLDRARPNDFNHDPCKQAAPVEACRAANVVAKASQAFQQGILTLQRIRSGGQQKVTVVHQHVQVAGGHVAVAGTVNQGGGKHGGE